LLFGRPASEHLDGLQVNRLVVQHAICRLKDPVHGAPNSDLIGDHVVGVQRKPIV
jgi:hypothetical protein